jgi:EKC/KEOPS complex subunit PCC1/LAGE3
VGDCQDVYRLSSLQTVSNRVWKREEKTPLTHNSTIKIPFPTAHLARSAQRALAVDKELSSLVTRSFTLIRDAGASEGSSEKILAVEYAATTDRMLRVAVNGFFESLGVVLHCMEELDVDVVEGEIVGGLEGVQGLEVKAS